MVITKTPFRISFFGGGTDIPEYFADNPGAVISTTFDKYCYVTTRHLPRFFDYRNSVVYSKIERVQDAGDIEHPLVRNAIKFLDMREMSVAYDADLPARTGLGTSSSFAVGLLNSFYVLKGRYADKARLAREAIYLERQLCAEAGGWQDQIAASFGGLNRIDFSGDSFTVSPIIIPDKRKKQFAANLMLFFTGFSRFSAEIQAKTQTAIAQKKDAFREIYRLVDEAQNILTDRKADLAEIGLLLDCEWKLKRTLNERISNSSIDAMYEAAIRAGARGGKLLGAGGGGFLLFYVEPERQPDVKEALRNLLYIPFELEDSGTQVLYYHHEEYDFSSAKSYMNCTK